MEHLETGLGAHSLSLNSLKKLLFFLISSFIFFLIVSRISVQACFLSFELVFSIVYISIFLFSFEIKNYMPDSSNLHVGISFLFAFIFEMAYLGFILMKNNGEYRLTDPGLLLWISMLWYHTIAILIGIKRYSPDISINQIITVNTIIAVFLFTIHIFFPGLESKLYTEYKGIYTGINAICFTLQNLYILKKISSETSNLKQASILLYLSVLTNIVSFSGVIFTINSTHQLALIFYFIRFTGMILCYQIYISLILKSPIHYMFCRLSGHSEELSQKNGELESALTEKEVLLKELHHRVKNNLQVISSFLSLQAAKSCNSEFKSAALDSQRRILTMSCVHDMQYENTESGDIDLSKYLKLLISESQKAFDRPCIRYSIKETTVFIPIGMAINCGLVVNELIVNSIKHAFPDKRGLITIRLEKKECSFSIIIEDNGTGIPEEKVNGDTMGFIIVSSLVNQLKGSYEIVSHKGTKITISVPLSFK